LKRLVEPFTGGEPTGGAVFIRRSLRQLSDELAALGHDLCPAVVGEVLRDEGFRLRVNVKRFTGPAHPDRDTQFRYLQEWVATFRDEGWPILSVDTKKKELIGGFKNSGAVWCQPADEVNAHDFLGDAVCRAVPYGIYDVLANRGHVVDHLQHQQRPLPTRPSTPTTTSSRSRTPSSCRTRVPSACSRASTRGASRSRGGT
jgi:hypothetical protein